MDEPDEPDEVDEDGGKMGEDGGRRGEDEGKTRGRRGRRHRERPSETGRSMSAWRAPCGECETLMPSVHFCVRDALANHVFIDITLRFSKEQPFPLPCHWNPEKKQSTAILSRALIPPVRVVIWSEGCVCWFFC